MSRRGRPRHPDVLTPREWQVLELLRARLTNHEIGRRLGISPDGVKYHVSEIIAKLGVSDRRQAAIWAANTQRKRFSLPGVAGGLATSIWTNTAGRLALAAATVASVAAVAVLAWGILTVKGGAVDLNVVPGVYVFEPAKSRLIRVSDPPYICGTQCGVPYDLLSWSPDGERLLINDSFGPSEGITLASLRDSSITVLPVRAWAAAWLPTGEIVAHGRIGEGNDGDEALLSIDPGSGSQTVLTLGGFGNLAFSQDGRFGLAIVAVPRQGVMLIDRTSGQQRILAEGRLSHPAWAPGAGRFAVSVSDPRDGSPSIAVYAADGTPISQGPPGDEPVWSPDGRLIATTDYRSAEDGRQPWIVIVDPSGVAPPRDLTRGESPQFALDSKSVALIRDGELWVVSLDGRDEQKLISSTLPMIQEAHWSPDGSLIAFIAGDGGGRLFTIQIDGRNERFLSAGTRPASSPDGSRIAFFFGSKIFAMRPGPKDIQEVGTATYSDAISPCTSGPALSWSPDSHSIAYWKYGVTVAPLTGGVVHIWDGALDRRIAEGYGPVWLPDGSAIAYTHWASTNPPNCVVSTVLMQGGAPALALEGALSPSWTRDGKYLAYLASQAPGPSFGEITIATADGKTIIKRLGSGRGFAWSPDGDHYAYVRLPGRAAAPSGPTAPLPPAPVVMPPDATVKLIIGSVVGGDPEIEIPVLFSSEFAWSPDGRSLAYTSREDPAAPSDIFVMEIAHPESPRYLTSGSSPGWLADGRTIVFSR